MRLEPPRDISSATAGASAARDGCGTDNFQLRYTIVSHGPARQPPPSSLRTSRSARGLKVEEGRHHARPHVRESSAGMIQGDMSARGLDWRRPLRPAHLDRMVLPDRIELPKDDRKTL